jgi:hypothetical protein
MGIEDWGDFEGQSEQSEQVAGVEAVDDPRQHTLGGFVPGRGFGPSEAESYDSPESLDFDETVDKMPFPEAAPGR